jgi:hypothetical protein
MKVYTKLSRRTLGLCALTMLAILLASLFVVGSFWLDGVTSAYQAHPYDSTFAVEVSCSLNGTGTQIPCALIEDQSRSSGSSFIIDLPRHAPAHIIVLVSLTIRHRKNLLQDETATGNFIASLEYSNDRFSVCRPSPIASIPPPLSNSFSLDYDLEEFNAGEARLWLIIKYSPGGVERKKNRQAIPVTMQVREADR